MTIVSADAAMTRTATTVALTALLRAVAGGRAVLAVMPSELSSAGAAVMRAIMAALSG
jgi:hypothetical protein